MMCYTLIFPFKITICHPLTPIAFMWFCFLLLRRTFHLHAIYVHMMCYIYNVLCIQCNVFIVLLSIIFLFSLKLVISKRGKSFFATDTSHTPSSLIHSTRKLWNTQTTLIEFINNDSYSVDHGLSVLTPSFRCEVKELFFYVCSQSIFPVSTVG